MVVAVSVLIFTSCDTVTGKVEEQLDKLKSRTNQLDSIINTEMDKVMKLDSVINLEDLKIKRLDSIVDKTSSKLDSIWQKYKRQ